MSAAVKKQHDGLFVMLDSLRGFGAVMVLIAHTYDYWGPWGRPGSAVAIDMFFMLSGFVIAYVYEAKFAAGMSVREFALHRIVRLYPLYLVGMALGIGMLLLTVVIGGTGDGAGEALGKQMVHAPLQLLMLPAPGDYLYPLNPPAWTLFFELAVNLVYVALWRWLTLPRLIVLVALFAVLLGVAVSWNGHLGMGGDWATFSGGLARSGFGFFCGVLIFRLAGSPKRPSQTRSLSWTIALVGAVVVMTYLPASAAARPVVDMLMLLVGGTTLIYLGARFEPPQWLVPPLATLGRISFALYVIHIPLYFMMMKITYKLPWLYDIKPFSGLLLLAVSLAVAYVAERWIDQPVRRIAMRKVKSWVKGGEWTRRAKPVWPAGMPAPQSSRRRADAPAE